MTAVGELLTPSGVVAGEFPPNTPDWYALRRTGIGSSDVSPILGYSRYRSAGHVWAEKRGDLGPDDTSEAGRWGHLLEAVIAHEWARQHDTKVAAAPTLRHAEHPHRLANLDCLVLRCPDTPAARTLRHPRDGGSGYGCALEIKTRSAYVAGSWREDVPDDVLAQCQWQLLVTGLPHVHVACLVGGQRLVEHLVLPEPAVQAYVAQEADAVWQAVQTGVRPRVDSSALLLDLLDRLYPDRSGDVEVDPSAVGLIRAGYDAGKALEADGKAMVEESRAALVALLGAGDTAVDAGGRPVATYRAHEQTHLDRDRLRKEFPDAWAACATTKKTRPVLRWK